MDPVTGAVILGGLGSIGGFLSGSQNEKMSKEQLALEKLLGTRGLDIQSAAVGDALRRQLESMPVRDRVLAQLQARMGQSPASFNPAGMFGNAAQPASTGGIDFGALQTAAKNYTPGSGGTRPDIAALMMQKLGYQPGGETTGTGTNPWQKQLTQTYSNPTPPPPQQGNSLLNLGDVLKNRGRPGGILPQTGGGTTLPITPKRPGFNFQGGLHGLS